MRESILTIPVNEVFEPREGCPICRMRDTVEQHICEYIMGAAMMEPDVRIETNKLGFCHTHYSQLMKQNNRLSLGLMLNSHLEELRGNIFEKKGLFVSKDSKAKKAGEVAKACVANGLLILTAKEKLRMLPPLTITQQELDEGLRILTDILSRETL